MEQVKLCECGCGRPTPLATHTKLSAGRVKGKPVRFIHGHNTRKKESEMYVKDPVTRCWVWVLGTNGVYGMIDKQPAHRVIYKKYKKKLSKKLQLDHLCKNTLCVNPDHLEPVTAAINIQRSRLAKLNADDVIEIRRRFALGVNQDALAREYGVTTASIYNVVMRRTWKNINAA